MNTSTISSNYKPISNGTTAASTYNNTTTTAGNFSDKFALLSDSDKSTLLSLLQQVLDQLSQLLKAQRPNNASGNSATPKPSNSSNSSPSDTSTTSTSSSSTDGKSSVNSSTGNTSSQPSKNNTLELTTTQQQNLRSLFGLQDSSPFTVAVLDKNGNGKLNAGDVAVMYGGITNGEISRRTLTAEDVKAINEGSTSKPNDLKTLAANEAKWKTASVGGDYDYTIQLNAFTSPDYRRPITVSVANGQVSNMTYADTGEAVPADRQATVPSINDLFSMLRDAYTSNAARVDVTYDPKYGFPSSLYIDQSEMMADEEFGYTVSDLNINWF